MKKMTYGVQGNYRVRKSLRGWIRRDSVGGPILIVKEWSLRNSSCVYSVLGGKLFVSEVPSWVLSVESSRSYLARRHVAEA